MRMQDAGERCGALDSAPYRLVAIGAFLWFPASAQLPPGCEPPPPAREAMAQGVSAGLYNALGAYFAQRSETTCAVEAFQRALNLAPDNPETKFNLGLALIQKGDLVSAVEHLREFSRSAPDFFQARMAYGTALAESGKHQAAVEEFAAAQRIDPQSVDAAQALADALRAAGKPEASIPHLQRVAELRPYDLDLQLSLGVAYAESNLLEKATEVLEHATKTHSRAAIAHFNLGNPVRPAGTIRGRGEIVA